MLWVMNEDPDRPAASRRLARDFACAAGLLGALYAAVSAYWAAGGTALLDTIGGALERAGRDRAAGLLVLVWRMLGSSSRRTSSRSRAATAYRCRSVRRSRDPGWPRSVGRSFLSFVERDNADTDELHARNRWRGVGAGKCLAM